MLTLAYCGLRWGELSGLRIRDLDLDGVATALDQAAMQSDVANLLPKAA